MYISVRPQNLKAGNSCRNLVNYLEKENQKNVKQETFFTTDNNKVSPEEVIKNIDENAKKLRLKKNEPRFYNVMVSPSAAELRTIENNPEKLKSYIKDVMQEYADNFNRTNKDGTKLTINDFEWYGKLEKERSFGSKDPAVRHNEKYVALEKCYNECRLKERLGNVSPEQVKQSDLVWGKLEEMKGLYVVDSKGRMKQTLKPNAGETIVRRGLDKPGEYKSHIHVIVSRAHKTERMSLSPMANNRGGKNVINGEEAAIGFNRQKFAQSCEKIYDMKFDHKREYNTSVDSKMNKAKGWEAYTNKLVENAVSGYQKSKGQGSAVGYNQLNKFIYDAVLGDGIDDMKNLDKNLEQFVKQYYPSNVANALERKVKQVKEFDVLGTLTDANLPIKVIKEVAQSMAKAVTQGYGI